MEAKENAHALSSPAADAGSAATASSRPRTKPGAPTAFRSGAGTPTAGGWQAVMTIILAAKDKLSLSFLMALRADPELFSQSLPIRIPSHFLPPQACLSRPPGAESNLQPRNASLSPLISDNNYRS